MYSLCMNKILHSSPWPKNFLKLALDGFALPQSQEHGVAHWARVRAHGVRMAKHYDLDPRVPSLFGLFHDCKRLNEYYDPEHGPRAASFVNDLAKAGQFNNILSNIDVDHLIMACEGHSEGLMTGPLIVQICWDADRLDLGRVGIRPDPRRLCTEAAKNEILRAKAYQWSRGIAWREDASPAEIAFGIV